MRALLPLTHGPGADGGGGHPVSAADVRVALSPAKMLASTEPDS
jgi:hypothetical protein